MLFAGDLTKAGCRQRAYPRGTAADSATRPSAGSVEHDVLAIRDAVFLPMGGGVYGKARRDTFEWPTALPEFMIASASIRVTYVDQHVPSLVPVSTPVPGMSNVIFVRPEDLAALHLLPTRLGGTRRREPQGVMDVPNQPVGDAQAIVRFWSQFFFARSGHWGGWLTSTPPSIGAIQFLNTERTQASASVRFAYTGATVVLEKQAGAWVAKELTGGWIE